MDKLNNIVLLIQHYLADYILIILLLGGGVIFTIRLGFIQIRGFKAGWKRTFGGLFSKKGTAGKDGMSSFQALATAIAAQVGTGNIAGAATALAIGGRERFSGCGLRHFLEWRPFSEKLLWLRNISM